jgi:hypothetical protein
MIRATLAVSLLIASVAGAAVAQDKTPTEKLSSRQKVSPTIVPNFNQPDLSVANSAYTMTSEDMALDCKKLTGRMAIRIRQLRAAQTETKTTALSRGLQQAATPFIAGTTRGINPDGDNARDLSMLKAFNARLAEKSCAVYDLDAQLKPGATEAPRPIQKPKAPPAAR